MRNKNRHKQNQPPTGQGKRQSARSGEARKLTKRSVVVQAQRGRPDVNLGDAGEEEAWRSTGSLERTNPKRPKAGR